jgi:NADPH:quinone reductase-like Zn-dependent oxidoreductase
MEDMVRVLGQHSLKPVIDSVYSLEDAKAAWAYFAGRQLFGKVVIRH